MNFSITRRHQQKKAALFVRGFCILCPQVKIRGFPEGVASVKLKVDSGKLVECKIQNAEFGERIATHTCGMLAMTDQCHSERSEESVFPQKDSRRVLGKHPSTASRSPSSGEVKTTPVQF